MRPGDLDHLLLKLDAELCNDARYIDIRDQISDIIENEPPVPQDCSDCKRYDSPYFEVKFDKEQMQELVDKAKAEVLSSIEMTTLVTLSDGWGHVREAYYDKGRQLVFTEWTSVKELESGYININERKELSDSEVHKDD